MKTSFLFPQQKIFFKLLNELSKKVEEIANLFKVFIDAINENGEIDQNLVEQATKIENQADDITHQIIDKLNRTFVTPLDQEDIHFLAIKLDDIVDGIENVVVNISIYNIKEKKDFLNEFAQLYISASLFLNQLIKNLVLQKYNQEVDFAIRSIHDLEDQGDEIYLKVIKQLFQDPIDPIAVLKWKDIVSNLEKIIDKYQTISDLIEGILVKSQ